MNQKANSITRRRLSRGKSWRRRRFGSVKKRGNARIGFERDQISGKNGEEKKGSKKKDLSHGKAGGGATRNEELALTAKKGKDYAETGGRAYGGEKG